MNPGFYIGDCLDLLAQMPDQSVHCVVTSPPYYALRSYLPGDHPDKDKEIGSEPTLDAFLATMVEVFRAVHRVLRDDGTLWLNLGSSYASNHLGRSADACGNGDTEHQGSTSPDSACRRRCDVHQGFESSHTENTSQRPHVSPEHPDTTGRDSGQAGCGSGAPDASAPGVPLSTNPSLPGCAPDACDPEGAASGQTSPCSSPPDAQGCARRARSNPGTSETSKPSDRRRQDTEPSFLALDPPALTSLYSTIASHRFQPKDLLQVPNLVALALQLDGWILRSEICWHKVNPMPESCTDRPTNAHEKVFLFAKRPRYFYDGDAVREANSESTIKAFGNDARRTDAPGSAPDRNDSGGGGLKHCGVNPAGRNLRNVWTIPTQAVKFKHYATFPEKLVEPCIKAGTSQEGVCVECGAPWERVVEVEGGPPKGDHRKRDDFKEDCKSAHPEGTVAGSALSAVYAKYGYPLRTTTGWRPTCGCDAGTKPALVLDPFMGSGTVARVCERLGREWLGFDLDERNAEMCELRLRRVQKELMI